MEFPVQDFVRERFTDYGTSFSVDIRPRVTGELEIIPQKCFKCPSGMGLFPLSPTLPLLPPNNYVDLEKEPCMEDKNRLKTNLKLLLHRVARDKTSVTTTFGQFRARELLENLEDLDGVEEKDMVHGFQRLMSDVKKEACAPTSVRETAKYTAPIIRKELQDLNVNSDYTGGCLSYLPYGDTSQGSSTGILVHPSGQDLSKLAFNEVGITDHQLHMTGRRSEFNLEDYGCIFETTVATTQHQNFVMCRQAKRCSIFRFGNLDDSFGSNIHLVTSHTFAEDDSPSSISVSPYIASEHLVSTKAGSVYLWSPQSTDQKPVRVYEDEGSHNGWTSCHFGGHPRLAVFANRTSVSLLDIGRSHLPLVLCSLPHRCFDPSEKIMIVAKHPSMFYHFVATDSHLVLMDERKPNDPVLQWSPWFLSPPQYMDLVPGVLPSPAIDELLLVGTQKSAETICFQLHPKRNGEDGSYPWQACGNYWRTSKVDCFARLATKQGHGRYHSLISTRLHAPLVGVCGVAHGATSSDAGLSVVQMTSFGDLFCQDYKAKWDNEEREKTCCTGPGSEDILLSSENLEAVGPWLDEARTQFSVRIQDEVPATSKFIDASKCFQDIQPKFAALRECRLCNRHRDELSSELDDDDDFEVCLACNTTLADSQATLKAVQQDRAIPIPICETDASEPLDEALVSLDVEVFHDPESQLLLKLWRGETDIEEMLIQREQEHQQNFASQQNERNLAIASKENDDEFNYSDSDEGQLSDDRSSFSDEPNDQLDLMDQDSLPCDQPRDPFADEDSRGFVQDENTSDPPAKRQRLESNLSPASNPSDTTPPRQRRLSTSSVRSVLSNTPGFLVTPSHVRPAPSPARGPPDDLFDLFHGPLSRTPNRTAEMKPKRKPYQMGF